MKKIGRISTTIIVAIIVAFALGLMVSKALGMQVFTIASGSMEPEYKTGSLIFVKGINPKELTKGDVITFAIADDMTATHRIVEVKEDGFVTKGDANEAEDAGIVRSENIVGTPVITIPYMGYIIMYLKTPPWNIIAIVLIVVLIISLTLPIWRLLFKGKERNQS